jgi:hypothetical protein
MGMTLAIDDFGTRYSSFNYLRQFGVSKLKIDRTFIRDVTVNPDDAANAKTIQRTRIVFAVLKSARLGLQGSVEPRQCVCQFLVRIGWRLPLCAHPVVAESCGGDQ